MNKEPFKEILRNANFIVKFYDNDDNEIFKNLSMYCKSFQHSPRCLYLTFLDVEDNSTFKELQEMDIDFKICYQVLNIKGAVIRESFFGNCKGQNATQGSLSNPKDDNLLKTLSLHVEFQSYDVVYNKPKRK